MLKWAGGKSRLLAQYAPFYPRQFGAYFEPFVGGGAVFFALAPKGPVRLSDVNDELINFYRVLQTSLDPLLSALERHRRAHDPDHYYQVRSEVPLDAVERAARLLYLNKTCYNGLYRVNSQGRFNVPLGRYKNPSILQDERLRAAHRAMQGVELAVEPFYAVLQHAREGDFVYFDPPYQPVSETANFTSYTKDSFGPDCQRHLAEVFRELSRRGVQVLLSNSDTEFIRELYAGFQTERIAAPRFINSKADRRAAVGEVLIVGRLEKGGRAAPGTRKTARRKVS